MVTQASQTLACPRCYGQLVVINDERKCRQCGWIDYSYMSERESGKKTLVSSGTSYHVRYIGDSPNLRHTILFMKVVRVGNGVAHKIQCPFCLSAFDKVEWMTIISFSRKRIEETKGRQERYKCMEGHRIFLTSSKDGCNYGWR